jgi:probable F420-dependent oxidoreductase
MDRPPLRLCISLSHVQDWSGGDLTALLDVARLADEAGIDQLSIADHLLMTEADAEAYPYGTYYQPIDYPWPEPISCLSAIAAVTRRIELSTGILIAPLRSAALIAKQLATLDGLSHGRVVAGFGAGWQKSEYLASGVAWEGRFGLLAEQIGAMRALWGEQPARFSGRHIAFEDVYATPRPYRQRSIPIWLGLGLGPLNLERIVTLADGWLPIRTDVDGIIEEARLVRAACSERGRDPASLMIRASPSAGLPSASPDLHLLRDQIARLAEGGIDVVQVYPFGLCAGRDTCTDLFGQLAEMRDELVGKAVAD